MLTLLLACATLYAVPVAGEKMLVLGFNSTLLNDVQDRLLRETVLRGFLERGYPIVPVMEIEGLIQATDHEKLRTMTPDEQKRLCHELGAVYSISGIIYEKNSEHRAADRIVAGRVYVCDLLLYVKKGDSFHAITIEADGDGNLFAFYKTVSERIIAAVEKKLAG